MQTDRKSLNASTDTANFRIALQREQAKPESEGVFDSIVGLLLARDGAKVLAMTTTSFAEAAHHPCSLWVAIEKNVPFHELVERTGVFSLAVLHDRQQELAQRFSSSLTANSTETSQLNSYDYQQRFLFLYEALACTACEVRRKVDFGERTLFIADIMGCHVESRRSHLRQLLVSDLNTA